MINKIRIAFIAVALTILAPSASLAGDLIIGGTITRVANTDSNSQSFAVRVEGETSACVGVP